nr:hypothetical protein [Deinococcus budaensis]
MGLALLTLLTLLLAALTLGTFASLNPGAPLWLRSLGSAEGLLSAGLGLGGVPGFARGLGLALLTSGLAGALAALWKRG